MVLPSGTAFPPVPYLLLGAALAGLVGFGLWRAQPAVSSRLVLSLSPWMVTGSALYVTSVLELAPSVISPLLGSPTVYLSTGILAGAVWLLALQTDWQNAGVLAATGIMLFTAVGGSVLLQTTQTASLQPTASLLAIAITTMLAAVVWIGLGRVRPRVTQTTAGAGALVVAGHTLDGVSTAVGTTRLGLGEQTPLSRAILEFSADLPALPFVGSSWLFVLLKVGLAVVVVLLFTDYAREEPSEANALLALLAAVGLGPGAFNIILFAARDLAV